MAEESDEITGETRTISSEKIPEDYRYPGAYVEVDGEYGMIESIIGGRARVDFGHSRRNDKRKDREETYNHRRKCFVPKEYPTTPDLSIEYDKLDKEKVIGDGGGGNVKKANVQTSDGNVTLAIKEPRHSDTLHIEQVERMLHEAETWDKLDDHDHIVGVVDYSDKPLPWIALEYMDGGNLRDRAREMDVPQALWTAIAVTKGVRHAHRRGVAHLDLKPENVLFRTVENAWDVPKVADWGVSQRLLVQSNGVEGVSPRYSAPEQVDEHYGQADDLTDIYQLGLMFYETFTGRPPFHGSASDVTQAVLTDEPTPPSEIADLPTDLDDILLTALSKEKDDRYEDIVYLRDDLRNVFDSL